MLNMILIVFFGEFGLTCSLKRNNLYWYCQAHPLLFEFVKNLSVTRYVLIYNTMEKCSEVQCYTWFEYFKIKTNKIEIRYVGKQKNKTLVFRSLDGDEYLHRYISNLPIF
mgnify:CR=1 FL=1